MWIVKDARAEGHKPIKIKDRAFSLKDK